MGILALCASASSEVILDQIGPMDGSGIGDSIPANQYFEPTLSNFDVAVIDNLNLQEQKQIVQAEFVIGGWDGFSDPSSITSYEANVYSSSEAASISLIGDVVTQGFDIADVTIDTDWYGEGFLIALPFQTQLEAGSYWFSIIPSNSFGTDGQTGLFESLNGDSTLSNQANPNEGFGWPEGPLRELNYNAAFRLYDDIFIDPCTKQLSSFCVEDVDNDGFVSILDLLEIISQWEVCGDGTYRPSGDIAPMPNGDCCVNILDLLAIVSAWNFECEPHGACCLSDGTCEELLTQHNCLQNDGYYFGNETSCSEESCDSGACCIDTINCVASSQFHCAELSGIYKGNGTICKNEDCSVLAFGDECTTAIETYVGSITFNTALMTPSENEPDDSLCADSGLDWMGSPDVWFSFDAPDSEVYLFSLCDPESYDTSMVLYEETCGTLVACNGDANNPDEDQCQPYYSAITHLLSQNKTYFIRIGGWQGQTGTGTLTISLAPPTPPGACCFTEGACMELEESDCGVWGGTFQGEDVMCTEVDCPILEGEECVDAVEVYIGTHAFSTDGVDPSYPEPDDSMCPDSFLAWYGSPDIWRTWVAPDSGIATFTTCDPMSFDTSMVLYEGNCDNQIACNGDADPSADCQSFYSQIDYPVTAGSTYIIRIGGWQASVGSGTLTILLDGDNDLGACCFGKCLDAQTQVDCEAVDGVWILGENCTTFNCDDIPCNSAIFTQNPYGPAEPWYAYNSSYDPANGDYVCAEQVDVATSNTVTVWGFPLYLNGSIWQTCDGTYDFNLRAYDDNNGYPGQITAESLQTPATKVATGTLYGGEFELMRWEMDFNAVNVEHISVQSDSDGLTCWFLWATSGTGDGRSMQHDGDGWSMKLDDLSICIE